MADGICEHIKATGERCRARSMTSSPFCYWHNPNTREDVKAAGRKGGKRGKMAILPADTPEFLVGSTDDITGLLAETISQVRRGEIDPRVANAIGYLSGIILKSREQGEIEERIKRLEEYARSGGFKPAMGLAGANNSNLAGQLKYVSKPTLTAD